MPLAQEELDFLVELYECTGGSTLWLRKDGWGEEGVDPCDWYGVSIVGERLRAISLPVPLNPSLSKP